MKSYEIVGGPLDGSLARTGQRLEYGWVDDITLRVSTVWKPGRTLHRRTCGHADVQVYLYVGNSHGLCDGCGSLHKLADGRTCTLCGGALVAR